MEFLTLQEVANLLRTKPSILMQYIIWGQLPALKLDQDWLIERDDLLAFLSEKKYYRNTANRVAELEQLLEDCKKASREKLEQYANDLCSTDRITIIRRESPLF